MKAFPESSSIQIPNTLTQQPKTFEIDCLVNRNDAIEIKWRDATTDGDHVAKEKVRVQNIKNAGYKPIQVMFYYPNRKQSQKIQQNLQRLYEEVGGEYCYGESAWRYIKSYTKIHLLEILQDIASERKRNEI